MAEARSRPAQPRQAAGGVLLVLLLALAPPALAHGLYLFAGADGRTIEGRVYYAGGRPAAQAEVSVRGADGTPLAALEPDGDGAFSYQARAPEDHLLVAETADGHRAQWPVSAAELAPGFVDRSADRSSSAMASAPATSSPPVSAAEDDAASKRAPEAACAEAAGQPSAAWDEAALIAALERAVARQVRPLREELAEARSRAALRDLLGGLGYLFGLAGIGLWWRVRAERRAAGGASRP